MDANDSSIALIIPHRDDRENLNHLLQSIKSWTKMADEIIIVDSSQDLESIQYDFVEFCSSKKITLIHHQSDELILSPGLRSKGTKTGFYGFKFLIPPLKLREMILNKTKI